MTEKELLIKLINNGLEKVEVDEEDKNNFFRINEELNEVIVIGEELQEIHFRFNESNNLIWFY